MIHRKDPARNFILVGFASFALAMHHGRADATRTPFETQVVYRESGRFAGWPANNGLWSWGEEILVGFTAAYHQEQDVTRHQMDRSKPREPRFARSIDGGRTWKVEKADDLLPAEAVGPALKPLTQSLDFTRPGFILTLRYRNDGLSFFYYSNDKGRIWHGPHPLPNFGTAGLHARTDYLIEGPKRLTTFLTAVKTDGKEGRPLCVRTENGGITWSLVSFIGPEPEGFSIMPSTVMVDGGAYLTVVRVKHTSGNWLEAWRSNDQGGSWSQTSLAPVDTGGMSGNPAHMIRLRDRRLCITYGYRTKPYRMCARLSTDEGRTWGEEIVLHTGAVAHDLGYPRSVEQANGRIVTVYYFNDGAHTERFIAATTWAPPRAP